MNQLHPRLESLITHNDKFSYCSPPEIEKTPEVELIFLPAGGYRMHPKIAKEYADWAPYLYYFIGDVLTVEYVNVNIHSKMHNRRVCVREHKGKLTGPQIIG